MSWLITQLNLFAFEFLYAFQCIISNAIYPIWQQQKTIWNKTHYIPGILLISSSFQIFRFFWAGIGSFIFWTPCTLFGLSAVGWLVVLCLFFYILIYFFCDIIPSSWALSCWFVRFKKLISSPCFFSSPWTFFLSNSVQSYAVHCCRSNGSFLLPKRKNALW